MPSKKNAILGTGPSAIYAALLLSMKGGHVTVYDPKTSWERPCGGAVAGPVLEEMPYFEDYGSFVDVGGLKLLSPKNRVIRIDFEKPLPIALRDDVTAFLTRKAEKAGIVFSPDKLLSFHREGTGWALKLKGHEDKANLLIAADGACSLSRKTLGINGLAPDTTMEVGFDLSVPFEDSHIGLIKFLPEMRGCFWALPNGNGTTVRLWSTGKQLHARPLLEKLDAIVQRLLDAPLPTDLDRNVAQIPMLKNITRQNVLGSGWATIGDAGGLVHPLSKDGLYFGLKSAAALALSYGDGGLDKKAYWRRLNDQVMKPLRKRASRQKWWNNHFVVDWILRRTKVSEKSRRFLSELVGAKPI